MQTERQTERKTERKTDRKTDRKTERMTDRKTDRETATCERKNTRTASPSTKESSIAFLVIIITIIIIDYYSIFIDPALLYIYIVIIQITGCPSGGSSDFHLFIFFYSYTSFI